MRALVCTLLLVSFTLAETEPGWVSHVSYQAGPLHVTLLNHEQPRGKPFLIVHFEVRNEGPEQTRCDWSGLVTLRRQDGTTMSPNYDALVDSGTGPTRTSGPFPIPRKRKARVSVLFVLGPQDLPGYLVLPDGRRSARIEQRGKVRWTP
jgi:hypothetical protein